MAGDTELRHRIRGVYLLTRETAETDALCTGVADALRGGVRIVQYRDKSGDADRQTAQTLALRALTRRHDAVFIVNDDLELALRCDADGVHLGEHDGDIAAVRARWPAPRLIGASCYDDPARALRATQAGADYVAFGAFFPSTTKPGARKATLATLRDAAALTVPRVAIGGIDAHNARPVIDAGADAVAVLGAIWDAPDRERAARALTDLFPLRSS